MTRPASSVSTALLLLMSACSPAGKRVDLGNGFSAVLVDEGAIVRSQDGDDAVGVELTGAEFAGGTVASVYEDTRAPAGFLLQRKRQVGRFKARLYRLKGENGYREYRWVVAPPDLRDSVAQVAAFRCRKGGCRTVRVLFDTLQGPPSGPVRTSPSAPPPPAPRPRLSAASAR